MKDFVLFPFKFKIITCLEFDLVRWIEMMILYILKVIMGIKNCYMKDLCTKLIELLVKHATGYVNKDWKSVVAE